MLLQEAMMTLPVRGDFSCNSWPGGVCHRYYGFKAQEYYVDRMTIALCVAGGVGVIAGFLRSRSVASLAMVLTLIPFCGIIENGIYTLGNSDDVWHMCTDPFWVDTDRVGDFFGVGWDCDTQEIYHSYSILFMVIASSVSLFHLWICLRFSEKIQSENERRIDETHPNPFERVFISLGGWFMDSKRMIKMLLVLSLFVAVGGIVQIAYGQDATSSKQTERFIDEEFVYVLDSSSYIDAHNIYGFLSIMSAASIWLYYFYRDRALLCLVFCLLVETHAIGFHNLIWHEIDLLYGIIEFAVNDIFIYPLYINGEARDTLCGSIQVYYVFNILIMITIFATLITSEAIQEEKKDMILSKTKLPMGILD